LKAKIGDHRLYRKIALEGHRYTPPEALQDGILDYIVKGKTADILAKAEEIADKFGGNAVTGVWGLIKVDLHILFSLRKTAKYQTSTMNRETCIVKHWNLSRKMSD
jgi:enoyl-CoA hydratase/carnithine racemase